MHNRRVQLLRPRLCSICCYANLWFLSVVVVSTFGADVLRAQDSSTEQTKTSMNTPGTQAGPQADTGNVLDADAELGRARNVFAYGDYALAADLLSELVLPGNLTREVDLVEAHRMLGIAFYMLDKKDEAKREFMALLYLAPETQLDPFLTPPAVVEFFTSIRASIADKLVAVREQRERSRPVVTADTQITVVERRIRKSSIASAFVPLGYPQFERGQFAWATALLASQGLGLTAGTVLYWIATLGAIDSDGHLPDDNNAFFDNLRIAQYLCAALAVTSYAIGVSEAVLAHHDETIESERLVRMSTSEVNMLTKPQSSQP